MFWTNYLFLKYASYGYIYVHETNNFFNSTYSSKLIPLKPSQYIYFYEFPGRLVIGFTILTLS